MSPWLGALALVASLATSAPAPSQPVAAAGNDVVELRTILQHPHWLGRPAQNPYWGADSETLYFEREAPITEEDGNRFDPRIAELYRLDLDEAGDALPVRGQEIEPLAPDQLGSTESPLRVRNASGSLELFVRHGDLFVLDLRSGEKRQLTRTEERESGPFFFVDGRVGFVRDHAVFALQLDGPLVEQVLAVRAGESPLGELETELREADELARQQTRLFDWIRDEQVRQRQGLERDLEERRADGTRPAAPVYLGKDLAPRAVFPSPSGAWAAVLAGPAQPPPPKGDKMPAYVSASGYVEVRDVRPKVGEDSGGQHQLIVVDIALGAQYEIDLATLPGILDDPLADLRQAAEEREKARRQQLGANGEPPGSREADAAAADGAEQDTEAEGDASPDEEEEEGKEKEEPPSPRSVDFGQIAWNGAGTALVFQAFSTDNKDRWIARIELPEPGMATGEAERTKLAVHSLLHDHDPAWINWRFRDLFWLPDDRHLITLSERTGFSQLYRLDAAATGDAAPQPLTRGEFVVDAPQIAARGEDAAWIYFLANASDPGTFDVYRVLVLAARADDAQPMQRITALGGNSDFALSPDGKRLALLHSTSLRPPELYVQPSTPAAQAQQLTSFVSEEFLDLPWVEPVIVDVPSAHQERPIRARLFLPDAQRFPPGDRPAAFFVHGAGYLQNAHRGWSGYFRETMFSTLLAQRGYVVLDMDYRGSAGYGRDWRTAIYRQMGTPEVQDLADGVHFVVERHGVDEERIGVWGGSYGGFLTFMAMFNQPDLFAAGAALRPVTDWAHYNHPYTSNILNTPELDPEAYQRSSPIEFAEGLAKPLLICSGMLDDNVFFQDSVRLVQRLIELEKQDWEMALYPVEPHGFREPSSWLDEYRRILALFERHVRGVR